MNLTGRPVYQKGQKKKKSNRPTAKQLRMWNLIAQLPCRIRNDECKGRLELHHCGTGAGGNKDHDKVLGLCYMHHRGALGIDGKQNFTKRSWQENYGSEDELLEEQRQEIELAFNNGDIL